MLFCYVFRRPGIICSFGDNGKNTSMMIFISAAVIYDQKVMFPCPCAFDTLSGSEWLLLAMLILEVD